jgi:proline dehydrogenase
MAVADRVFRRVARPTILAAARSDRLRRAAERFPLTRPVVDRFVAGETLPDVLHSVDMLRASRRVVSIDYLGEHTTDVADAEATMRVYLKLLDAFGVAEGPPVPPLEVSLKLSALGQALPKDGEKIALENAHTICERAQEVGAWVTVDAEDHTTTDSTLSTVRELHADFDWLATALQAYLRRTPGDCADAAASGARIRLCKGAYDEPASVAYRNRDEVTRQYLHCLQLLMAGKGYPMVASHDPVIIDAVPAMARENNRDVGDFEYQMLFGIRDPEQRRLADGGSTVRVYVPFGTQWYGYFIRRLAERPANLTFFLRALAERRP